MDSDINKTIERLIAEQVEIVDYDPHWPEMFRQLKLELMARHPRDRAAYTQAKAAFVCRVTAEARQHYGV